MSYHFDKIIHRRSTNSIKWTQYPADVLPLWVADMDFRTPEPILRAIQAALAHGILGYELLSRKLQETVSARMDRLYSWKVEPEMVVAVPGLVSGLNAAARSVCEPGEGILMQPPVYFPFLHVHENVGLSRQFAPFVEVTDGNVIHYEIDFEAFDAALGSGNMRTRMFLMCNPHNPTGNVFSREQLSKMAEACLRNDVIICSDEIHSELLLDDTSHTPIATLATELAENTITLVAPSKTFNTAGLFCGFAIIPNPDLRARYQKVAEQMTFHVNSLGLIAAQVAFSGVCDGWLKEALAYLKSNRDFVVKYIQTHLPGMRTTVPAATYLAWLDCNPLLETGTIEGSPFEHFLENARVALSDGAQFGPGGEGFVRLNFACPRSNLEQALERMRDSLK